MAGDHGSQRFVKFRWAIGFTLGVAAGTLLTTLFGITDTLWTLAACSAVAGVAGMFEWFGQERLPGPRQPHVHRPRPVRMNFIPPPRKTSKSKPPLRRGQLHAITGRKAADPPSSGAA
jgi:hypothetical protein